MNGGPKDDQTGFGLDQLAPGRTFARYEIVRCIGVGGMGAVFEATHVLLKKRVALKTMHSNLVRSEASKARFLREAETVARIRHPNVVDVTDVGIEGGIPFLVMEFLEGEDLLRHLGRAGRLDARAAADALLPVAAGLCAVHRLGIVHRDVKPENILLARDAHGGMVPKLIDFGVSKDLEASMRSGGHVPNTVTGTPHYMSPEQARGAAQLDGRTDQYALGVLLYQCLSGRLPYESTSLLALISLIDAGSFRPLEAVLPDVAPELAALVHRAMAPHPRDRFASMELFGRALAEFASDRMRLTHERDFSPSGPALLISAHDPESLAERQAAVTTPADPTPLGDPFAPPLAVPAAVSAPATGPEPSQRLWLVVVCLVLLAGGGLLVRYLVGGDTPGPPPPRTREQPGEQPPGLDIQLSH
jgi:serine/threonine protein kinase